MKGMKIDVNDFLEVSYAIHKAEGNSWKRCIKTNDVYDAYLHAKNLLQKEGVSKTNMRGCHIWLGPKTFTRSKSTVLKISFNEKGEGFMTMCFRIGGWNPHQNGIQLTEKAKKAVAKNTFARIQCSVQ